MQWHKAKVSNLQQGLSLEITRKEHFEKGGEILKFKRMGGDEETNPKQKLKVRSWKDLANGLQSNRQECHIETQISLGLYNQAISIHK